MQAIGQDTSWMSEYEGKQSGQKYHAFKILKIERVKNEMGMANGHYRLINSSTFDPKYVQMEAEVFENHSSTIKWDQWFVIHESGKCDVVDESTFEACYELKKPNSPSRLFSIDMFSNIKLFSRFPNPHTLTALSLSGVDLGKPVPHPPRTTRPEISKDNQPLYKYRATKQVTAGKIVSMSMCYTAKELEPVSGELEVEYDKSGLSGWHRTVKNIKVDTDFLIRERPTCGEYYVVQEDGYQTTMPSDAFERKFGLVCD